MLYIFNHLYLSSTDTKNKHVAYATVVNFDQKDRHREKIISRRYFHGARHVGITKYHHERAFYDKLPTCFWRVKFLFFYLVP